MVLKTVFSLSLFLPAAGQLSQSAHFSLQLPYTVLGLGRSANFLDHLFVGIPQQPGETVRKHERVMLPGQITAATKCTVGQNIFKRLFYRNGCMLQRTEKKKEGRWTTEVNPSNNLVQIASKHFIKRILEHARCHSCDRSSHFWAP